jgi:hypothetical protein
MTEYKRIPDYENYEINENGEVRNIKKNTIMKFNRPNKIRLSKNGIPKDLSTKKLINQLFNSIYNNDFKIIPNYSKYTIDINGNVKSINGVIYKIQISKEGYKRINIKNDNGEQHNLFIHRLVAITYIDNPNNYPVVHHIDGNPLNNNVNNLLWCSSQYNQLSINKPNQKPASIRKYYREVINQDYIDNEKISKKYQKILNDLQEINAINSISELNDMIYNQKQRLNNIPKTINKLYYAYHIQINTKNFEKESQDYYQVYKYAREKYLLVKYTQKFKTLINKF